MIVILLITIIATSLALKPGGANTHLSMTRRKKQIHINLSDRYHTPRPSILEDITTIENIERKRELWLDYLEYVFPPQRHTIIKVDSWREDRVELEVKWRESKNGRRFVRVIASYNPRYLFAEKLAWHSHTRREFISIQFDSNLPDLAELENVNWGTGLTPREVEYLTYTFSNDWMKFVLKIAFEIVGVSKLVLGEKSSTVCRAEDGILMTMPNGILYPLSNKQHLSPYSKYGFIIENFDSDQHQAILQSIYHKLNEPYTKEYLLSPLSDYGCSEDDDIGSCFKKLEFAIRRQTHVFGGSQACEDEWELFRKAAELVPDLKDSSWRLAFDMYLTRDSYLPGANADIDRNKIRVDDDESNFEVTADNIAKFFQDSLLPQFQN